MDFFKVSFIKVTCSFLRAVPKKRMSNSFGSVEEKD